MRTIELNYKATDGKDYFDTVLDIQTGEVLMYKNPSCTASVISSLCEIFGVEYFDAQNRFKVFFNLNSPAPMLDRIPKKYHKFFIPQLTDVQKACKRKFSHLSNVELVNRINKAPDFGWDDEGVELDRRRTASNGKFVVKMVYNTLEIIQDEK